jgi:iron complex outermembrane receptor protein
MFRQPLMTRQGKFAMFLLFLIQCNSATAAENLSEKDFLQEFPLVLSASRLSQPLSESPNAVTIIDRAMIKASGFRAIPDLFRLVPGMYVDYKDGSTSGGSTAIVSYRGTTDEFARRMQVLVDGRSVYMQPFNTVNWEDLPLQIDDIERIEVVRGPSATSFGSNSILGVINIITLSAADQHGASVSANAGNIGNAGIADAAAHFGGSRDNLDYRFTVGKRAENGFRFSKGNDASITHLVNLRADYHPNNEDNVDVQLGYNKDNRNAGNLTQGRPLDFNVQHTVANTSSFEQLTWLRTSEQRGDLRLQYYHMQRTTVDEGSTFPLLGISYPANINMVAHRQELELQHTIQTGAANRLVWGTGVRYETVDAPTTFATPQSLHQSRLFMHDEWRITPQLVLNAGDMFENDGMGHHNNSPRAALNYHVTPQQTLRAGVSVAYRNPSLIEEKSSRRFWLGSWYQNSLSQGGLRPEHALSRELGYLGEFNNGWSIDARVYNDQVSDIIWVDSYYLPESFLVKGTQPDNTPATYGFRNEFAASYTGLESTVKYQWGQQKNSLIFNYARQRSSSEGTGVPIALTQTQFLPTNMWNTYQRFALNVVQQAVQLFGTSVPFSSVSVLFARQMDYGMSFSAGYYQQGMVNTLGGQKQSLNRRTDLRLAKQFGTGDNNKTSAGEVALVLQNAFNDNNVGYSGNVYHRTGYIAATYHF